MNVLAIATERARATICIFLLVLIAGIISRLNMAVEASPNPTIPIVVVSVFQNGISPEDGDRLIIRPLEKELRSLYGLKELKSTSRESIVYSVIEFESGHNLAQALIDVRAAVDDARAELPEDAEEPIVEEVSADGIPTIIVTVAGDVMERTLYQTARRLKQSFENIPDVLEAKLTGHREEMIEATVDPAKLDQYAITNQEFLNAVSENNVLIPAGQLDSGNGRFPIKIPALLENRDDIFSIPLRSDDNSSIMLGDVANVRRTFQQAAQYTAVNGQPALAIEVTKRGGTNEINVTRAVRAVVTELTSQLPVGVTVDFLIDQSQFSLGMVNEMQGNILTAMMLVMIIIVGALGLRSGLLVGLGVPFSLLFAAIILYGIGFSFNFMVLFGMLLALGMLIDGAIVITEFANRKMQEGDSPRHAYAASVKRMAWPVIASTLTTLAAFLPIMFWPGVAGEFMRYLPVTVFAILCGSLLYALLFAPVLGSVFGGSHREGVDSTKEIDLVDLDSNQNRNRFTNAYIRFLVVLVRRPIMLLLIMGFSLMVIFFAFGKGNAGTEFFVETEKTLGSVTVRAQGNISLNEAKNLVKIVEKRVLEVDGIKVVYNRVNPSVPQSFGPRQAEKDQIAEMIIETRDPALLDFHTNDIFTEILKKTEDLPGILVNAVTFEDGPPVGKPIQIELISLDRELLIREARRLSIELENNIEGLRAVTNSSSSPGIEWNFIIDRALAAQMGVNIAEVGSAIQLLTNGILVGEYRPNDADEEVEIRVRYPKYARGLKAMDHLSINTVNGVVPINTFVKRVAKSKIDKIERVDGQEYLLVMADMEEGVLADDKVKDISEWLKNNPLDPRIKMNFRGANEEQEKSQAYLSRAFLFALGLMFILLVAQFNSLYQAMLILSSVIMSTAGVLLGLLITQSTFSVIMTGVGIVALAGIVVNNNIVLIDTFNYFKRLYPSASIIQLAVSAAAQRLRPVFLTTITTILGLLPLASAVSVDLLSRNVEQGGVVGVYWVALASAIVYGLVFSTLLTLLVTPSLLVLPNKIGALTNRFISSRSTQVKSNSP